jgi:hypothetical protein
MDGVLRCLREREVVRTAKRKSPMSVFSFIASSENDKFYLINPLDLVFVGGSYEY